MIFLLFLLFITSILCLAASVLVVNYYIAAINSNFWGGVSATNFKFWGKNIWLVIGLILFLVYLFVSLYVNVNELNTTYSMQSVPIQPYKSYPLAVFRLGDEAFIGFLSLIATVIGFGYIYYQLRITRFESKSAMLDRIHEHSERIVKAYEVYVKKRRPQHLKDLLLAKVRLFIQLLDEFENASKLGSNNTYNIIITKEAAILAKILDAEITSFTEEGKKLREIARRGY